ncbi:MAG: hypothetical protein JNK60_10315, partial [Acidobacteria bacterium]|nr:hypothetical protein [Acidobacteriota bacterium]
MRFRLASLPLLALLAPVLGAQLLGATPATPAPALSKEIPAKDSLTEVESKKRQALELYLRAKLLAGEAEFEESVRLFRKAVELDPADGQLRLEFAEELRDLGVFSEAEVQARKAVELLGGTPITRRTLGQILLASARDRAGVEAASAELKSANDAQPLEPSGAIAYAQTLLRLERPAEAVPVLEKILDKGRGS